MKFKCAGITDSMNDAPGKIGLDVFFQGCSLKCPGCQNPDLQDPNGGFEIDTDEIINHLNQHRDFYQALVFLGGESLEQDKAVLDLASRSRSGLYNVLYTGWLYEKIPLKIKSVMDMIIDGPYIEELKTNGFPASENQRIYYGD
jgi:anaerobic ribonucleoside-triphosphate reductase activating protein